MPREVGLQVGQILRAGAQRHPARIAVVECRPEGRVEYDYRAVDHLARTVARRLLDAGLAPGDRVGLSAENGIGYLASYFGALYAGITVVPLPIVSAAPEIAFRIDHASLAAMLFDAKRRDVIVAAVADRPVPTFAIEELTRAKENALDVPLDPPADSVAMILYTSGTTGKPKGACITHASLVAHTAALVHHTLGLGADDRVFAGLPLTHSFGMRMAVLAPFYAGACTVMVPRFDAAHTLELLATEAITWAPAVPTMFSAWAHLPGRPVLPALRWALSAGAPLPEEIRRAAEEKLGVEIRQGYGLTEATFSTVNAPPDPRVEGSVGRAVWGVELAIVDEEGKRRSDGEEGEVVVRGQNVMAGYLHDGEATEEVVRDGWLHTGDIGRLDAEGRLFLVDRKKDLILRGGHNVYPSEVEDVLASHPAIREVAVIGRPDPHYGEEVVAVVILHPDHELSAEALFTWAADRVARYKLPRELAVTSTFPLGPSGKVLKRELRAMLADGRLVAGRVAARFG